MIDDMKTYFSLVQLRVDIQQYNLAGLIVTCWSYYYYYYQLDQNSVESLDIKGIEGGAP